MKEIIITSGEVVGYKKPILWVVEGNVWEKVASFNSEEAKELFVKAMSGEDNFERK